VLRTYRNAESAMLYGGEVSVRQGLDLLGDWGRDFYVKLNGAVMDSEVEVAADAIVQTNPKRPLQGQSDWVVNTQLTYDNLVNDWQSTIAFNMFGERVADVGVQGFDDAYEQPAPQLDFIHRQGFRLFGQEFGVRFRAENLLNPKYERTRGDVTEREYRTGRSFQIKLEWEF
jgi:hypothetical protein